MNEVLVGFHLIAIAIFVLGCAVVGTRLVWLSSRTRRVPELLLGSAVLGTGVLGYGTLVWLGILQAAQPEAPVSDAHAFFYGFGKIAHNLGVTLFLVFVVYVFRPKERWAYGLAGAAMLLMWTGLAWGAAQGAFREDNALTAAWWCEYGVVFPYSLWLCVESLTYWARMRKRQALGLADPLVTNRFLLWGIGSFFTFSATMIAGTPLFLKSSPELVASIMPTIYVGTAVTGVASITCSYLAFLPPEWFIRSLRLRAAEETG